MRVVVTRPEISARRTAERLVKLGHEPVMLPLFEPIHDRRAAETALGQPHAALAITSTEAVRALSELGAALSPHLTKSLYAVGNATAKAAGDLGFSNIRTGAGTGAELAAIIAADALQFAGSLLYLAGKPRSQKFEEGLQAENVTFAAVEIYCMKPLTYDHERLRHAIAAPPPDAVLFYSRETAAAFFDLAAPLASRLDGTRFFCLSDNVAEAVPEQFHRNIKIAAHPDEDGIFTLL